MLLAPPLPAFLARPIHWQPAAHAPRGLLLLAALLPPYLVLLGFLARLLGFFRRELGALFFALGTLVVPLVFLVLQLSVRALRARVLMQMMCAYLGLYDDLGARLEHLYYRGRGLGYIEQTAQPRHPLEAYTSILMRAFRLLAPVDPFVALLNRARARQICSSV